MMRTELFLGPKWEPTDRWVCFEVVSDGRRCACSMRLPYPSANEAVSFFRENWNWIKDRGAKPFARLVNVVSSHPPDPPRAESEKRSGGSLGVPRGQRECNRDLHGQRQAPRLPPGKRQPSCRHTGMSPVRAVGTSFGHLSEAQFPLALALGFVELIPRCVGPSKRYIGPREGKST